MTRTRLCPVGSSVAILALRGMNLKSFLQFFFRQLGLIVKIKKAYAIGSLITHFENVLQERQPKLSLLEKTKNKMNV